MGTYVVLSKVNTEGLRSLRKNPDRLAEIDSELRKMDGKVIEQWATLGEYDFCALVSAPDNAAIHRMSVEQASRGRVQFTVLPAIDVPLFVRLLGQTTETVGPYRWQISWWAQLARRYLRNGIYTKPVKEACQPLVIDGRENLKGFKGPAVIIGNHSSHLDAVVLYEALPERLKWRIAFGGAADRWFLKGVTERKKTGWYNSLAMNSFPIKRGGGASSLDYAKWLLDKKWSVMIFPEGTRSSTGKMGKFRYGVATLALEKNVPVIPIYMEGLAKIRPKGSQAITPGPVRVKIGAPIHFPPGTTVPEATHQMFRVMEALRAQVHRHAAEGAAVPSSEPAVGTAS
jgi:1-acyl-sn-glycerol-3-phosphate acyltransferase